MKSEKLRDRYDYVINSGIRNIIPYLPDYLSFYGPTFWEIRKFAWKPAMKALELGVGTGLLGMWLLQKVSMDIMKRTYCR